MTNTTTTVVNNKGTLITVNLESGWTFCDDCGGEFHPDDMKNNVICLTCHDDLHADDWTMEDA
jgi:hypothetical protein